MCQSLCNPPKSSLLAAIQQGFLHGAPHLSKKAITKYLPPSPATSKGQMKQPRKGLCSTTPKQPCIGVPASVTGPVMPSLYKPLDHDKDDDFSNGNPHFNIIDDVNNHSIANVFCYGAFANKTTGVIYNNCTSKFLFMSLNGNVCFFVRYHYKINTLATPIPGLDSASILEAYKQNFEYLKKKGYKPILNVIDNQATKVIKAYLAPKQVSLQLVEPHNHRVNTAKRAIQMFKNRFIGALGTTDANFPIQLWTNLPLKSRTPSIFSVAHAFILTTQLTKPLKGHMTRTATQWPPPAPRPSSMKIPTLMPRGRPMALTPGSSACLRTTTDAICTMSPKPAAIASLVQPTSFPSIALHHPTCTRRIFKNRWQNYKSHGKMSHDGNKV
jgi:hypothetical protein